MKRLLILCIVVMAAWTAQGQAGKGNEFLRFAKTQDSLFIESYKKRDVSQYHVLLKDFVKKYEALGEKEKKDYASFYVNAFYNLACTYSLINAKQEALDNLQKSIRAGYSNYANIARDSDLDNIRNEAAFQAMIQPLRETGDYLYILKKDNRFTDKDSIEMPRITYQSADAPELVRLRKEFNLDSIAGGGNEVSQLINVLHWVHNTVPHDGQHESGIKAINAYEITTVTKARKIGVSCGELATVLNECYLALGFKSRKIYCFPKDSLQRDHDSHVINAVYAPSLKKWLWMDPTNDAYVMNEKGELLGIEEVRYRLMNDLPLILNPDANWNRRASTTKDNYLYYYMAKNLYRFYTAVESKYDGETRGGERTVTYLHLYPSGYGKFKEASARSETYNSELKTIFVKYFTNNPAAFWQAP
jgi:hypothetical protein